MTSRAFINFPCLSAAFYYCAALAVVVLGSVSTLSADDEKPLVDVVVKSNLDTGLHARLYVQAISQSVSAALDGLNPVTYGEDENAPSDKAANGAAKFRLLVEHRGTISLGAVQRVTNDYKFIEGAIQGNVIRRTIDKAHWESAWAIKVAHRGTVEFKLLAWNGGSYNILSSWNTNIRNAYFEANAGSVTVAGMSQPTNTKFDRNPRCPVTEAEAKAIALEKMMPDNLAPDVLAHLVQATLKGLKAPRPPALRPGGVPVDMRRIGERPEARVELAIQNSAPWAIKAVSINVAWGDRQSPMILAVEHTFDKPFAPGALGTILHTGAAEHVAFPITALRHSKDVNITRVRFSPEPAVK